MAIKTASGSDLRNSLSSGLVLLNTTTFSGVASQSVNDVFSATYDNYRILINSTGASADQNLIMRFRVAGADNSSSVYNYALFGLTTGGTGANANNNNATSFLISQLETTGTFFIGASLDIIAPFLTRTKTGSLSGNGITTGGSIYGYSGGIGWEGSTSFTGFTLLTSSGGTISGSVSVYGYNK